MANQEVGRWRATYVPGRWVVLAGPTAMVIMPPAPPSASRLLNALWDDILDAASMPQLVEQLARFRVDQMPSFAAFFWHGDQLRSLMRGEVTAVNAATGERVAHGDEVVTWVEVGLGDVKQVRIDLEPVDQDEHLQLPLVTGVVTVAAVVLDATEAPHSVQLTALADGKAPHSGEPAPDVVPAELVSGPVAGAGAAVMGAAPDGGAEPENAVTGPAVPDLAEGAGVLPDGPVAGAGAAVIGAAPGAAVAGSPGTGEVPAETVWSDGEPAESEAAANEVPVGEAAAPEWADEHVPVAEPAVTAADDASIEQPAIPEATREVAGEQPADSGPGGDAAPSQEPDVPDWAEEQPAEPQWADSAPADQAPEPHWADAAAQPAPPEQPDSAPADEAAPWAEAPAAAETGPVDDTAPWPGPSTEQAPAWADSPAEPAEPWAQQPAAPTWADAQDDSPTEVMAPVDATELMSDVRGAHAGPPGAPGVPGGAAPFGAPGAPPPFGGPQQPGAHPGQPGMPPAPEGPFGPPQQFGQPQPFGQPGQPAQPGQPGQPGQYGGPAQPGFPGQGAPEQPAHPGHQPPSRPFGRPQPHGQPGPHPGQPGRPHPGQSHSGQPQPGPTGQGGQDFAGPNQPHPFGRPDQAGFTGPQPDPHNSPYAQPPVAVDPPAPIPQIGGLIASVPDFGGQSGASTGEGGAGKSGGDDHGIDHDGATVFQTGLARALKSAPAEGRDEAFVLASMCIQQHPNPPGATQCRLCSSGVPPQNPRLVARPVLAMLRPPSGSAVEVDRNVLIGRAPSANRVGRDQLPRLMTVPSPSHDISRTHVQVHPDEWDIVVTDLHSTNGTTLIHPGGDDRERLTPGEPVIVSIGAVLDLGDGVTIVIDAP